VVSQERSPQESIPCSVSLQTKVSLRLTLWREGGVKMSENSISPRKSLTYSQVISNPPPPKTLNLTQSKFTQTNPMKHETVTNLCPTTSSYTLTQCNYAKFDSTQPNHLLHSISNQLHAILMFNATHSNLNVHLIPHHSKPITDLKSNQTLP
jgi:hypothetical protein